MLQTIVDILNHALVDGNLFGRAFVVTTFDVVFWTAIAGLIFLAARKKSAALWPLVALAAMLLFNRVFTANFFFLEVKSGHLFGSVVDILNRGVPVMLLAMGMTLVIATGGVDLSVGSVMAISGAVAAWLITEGQVSFPVAAALAIGLTILLGAWNGLLVSVFGVQPIVATLILMVAGRGIALLVTSAQKIRFQDADFSFVAGGHFLAFPFPVTLAVIALIVTVALTRLTAMGMFIESVGDNETASRYSGLKVRWVKTFAYAFTGLCAGVAGLIVASNVKEAAPISDGMYFELDAILAVVIGGTALSGGRFHLIGSLVGALIIQCMTTSIYQLGVNAQYVKVVKASVVLAVCLLQSQALRTMIVKRRARA